MSQRMNVTAAQQNAIDEAENAISAILIELESNHRMEVDDVELGDGLHNPVHIAVLTY